MSVEQYVWWLARETEVLGENLVQCRFVRHKFHMAWPGLESGPHGGVPSTNSLSYGWAFLFIRLIWFTLRTPIFFRFGPQIHPTDVLKRTVHSMLISVEFPVSHFIFDVLVAILLSFSTLFKLDLSRYGKYLKYLRKVLWTMNLNFWCEEVAGSGRKLHSEDLLDLCSSPNSD
jgi:hypothetical protein